jgi:hypothetical protein
MKLKIFVIFLVIFFANCKEKEKANETDNNMNVSAEGGLRMRSEPSPEASTIITIPNNSKVLKIEETGEIKTISGKSGKWTKVKFNNTEGWVFGGFLEKSLMSAEKNQNNVSSLYVNSDIRLGCPDKNKKYEPHEFNTGFYLAPDGQAVNLIDHANWQIQTGNWTENNNIIYIRMDGDYNPRQECHFMCGADESCAKKCESEPEKAAKDLYQILGEEGEMTLLKQINGNYESKYKVTICPVSFYPN